MKNESYKMFWTKTNELRNKYPNALISKKPTITSFGDWIVDEKEPVQFNEDE